MSDGRGETVSGPGIAAATLILYYESDGKAARHLMIQRTAQMRFAPNALVFPGGRVDEDDHRTATDANLVDVTLGEPVELAHRVTAIREMLEEVGILVAFQSSMPVDAVALQTELKRKVPFSTLLGDNGIRLDLAALLPWAQWHPKFQSHRRFDTRFYITRHEGDRTVTADVDEVGQARWLHAHEAINEAEAGTAKIIFPTLCNLERLAAYPAFEAAKEHLGNIECIPISPCIEGDEHGESWICIPEDRGYPLTRRLVSTLQAP